MKVLWIKMSDHLKVVIMNAELLASTAELLIQPESKAHAQ